MLRNGQITEEYGIGRWDCIPVTVGILQSKSKKQEGDDFLIEFETMKNELKSIARELQDLGDSL